ncbi:Fic family protein [Flavobacterium arsenatis]|uniref:Fic family protein n=1 Tax=Flavobacterium arsenatis TaxID=1484332 RepID=A0ABU1TLR0_9FLAO|nr:Fic family protein [Flavobacterium arsenatis]MDR6966875.1 Fic family protein [Flavobacterium arsenatis]
MKITERQYFDEYQKSIGKDLKNLIADFDFSSTTDLGYQTQASAVYSSNIEGNTINLNSFMNYQLSKDKFKPQKEIKEIEDLIEAYSFAQIEVLNEKNFLKAHKIIARELLIKSLQGKYRNNKVGVFGPSGLVYLAIEAELVAEEMNAFFKEITLLLNSELSIEETFYFASMIHLRFVHIHPFRDGNGRAARLLEKWFLAQKLNTNLWKVPSEKHYKEHQQEYYNNINLGINFYVLNYNRCIPFLEMLPKSLLKTNN